MPAAAPVLVHEGQYWTNGSRLIYIERVTTKGVDVEDARDPSHIDSLTMQQLASWREVTPDGPA